MSFLRRFRKRVRKLWLRKKLATELDVIRERFRVTCHQQLDDTLNQMDPRTGLPMHDIFIAYAGQGCGVIVGVQIVQPVDEPETAIEEVARESGIEIVRA